MAHKTLAFFLMLLALVGLMFMAPQADRAPDAAHATDDVRPVFLQDLEGPAPDGSLLQAAAAGDGWVTVTWQQVQAGSHVVDLGDNGDGTCQKRLHTRTTISPDEPYEGPRTVKALRLVAAEDCVLVFQAELYDGAAALRYLLGPESGYPGHLATAHAAPA